MPPGPPGYPSPLTDRVSTMEAQSRGIRVAGHHPTRPSDVVPYNLSRTAETLGGSKSTKARRELGHPQDAGRRRRTQTSEAVPHRRKSRTAHQLQNAPAPAHPEDSPRASTRAPARPSPGWQHARAAGSLRPSERAPSERAHQPCSARDVSPIPARPSWGPYPRIALGQGPRPGLGLLRAFQAGELRDGGREGKGEDGGRSDGGGWTSGSGCPCGGGGPWA